MTGEKKKGSGILPVLLIIFVILATVLFFIFDSRKNQNQEQHLELLTERYQLAYNTVFEQYKQLAETLFSGLRTRYHIQEIYHKLLTADQTQKDALRQELLTAILPRYTELKKDVKLSQLHFHLPDNKSFLRLHAPEKYGDTLTTIRETVVHVNAKHSAIFGFEKGRMANGYRYVFPITDPNQTHLGSMEISFGPSVISSAIMKQYYVLSNFFIKQNIAKKEKLPQKHRSYYKMSPSKNFFHDTESLNDIKKFNRQDIQQLKLRQKTRDFIFAMVDSGQTKSTYDPSIDMVFTVLPVFNPVTREMNAFLTIKSFSNFFSNEKEHFWTLYSLSLLLLFLLLFTYYLQTSKRNALELKNREMNEQSRALIEAKEVAESANHAKSVFLSNMSHELRTPLNSILGYTQIFAGDSTLTPQQQSGIRTMHRSGQHLLMLINDILDLSKIEADKMELVTSEFRLSAFLKGIEDIIRVRSQKKGLVFLCNLTNSLPISIEADELRLRQVILNLLSNSIKFTDTGHCTLTVQSEDIDAFSIRLTIIIEDSGPGIATEMQKKIFSPFQQSGDRLKYSEGSGLGLTISQKIIRLMGGELQVTSPINEHPQEGEGVGSRFFFSIDVPVLAVDKIGKKEPKICGYICFGKDGKISEQNTSEVQVQKKILIVDDELSNRAVLHDILKPLGFITSEATDGCEVLAACERFSPDAILMDLRMPKVDGYTATKLIKEHQQFSHIPIIAISATVASEKTVTKRCRKHGFSAYINKPYSTTELLEILARELKIDLLYENDGTKMSMDEELIMVSPSQEILEQICNFSRSGDIDSIVKQADEIAIMENGKYKAFAQMLQLFAEDLQLAEIEKFVSRYKQE